MTTSALFLLAIDFCRGDVVIAPYKLEKPAANRLRACFMGGYLPWKYFTAASNMRISYSPGTFL